MSLAEEISALAARVNDACRTRGLKLGTAESCTGGLVAAALTDVSGASDVFMVGLVTYSNQAKIELLAVDPRALDDYGAVSVEVSRQMAEGLLKTRDLDLGVAITGIAGPDSDGSDKPVGLVHIATARRDGEDIVVEHREERFGNIGRGKVREKSVSVALQMLEAAANQ